MNKHKKASLIFLLLLIYMIFISGFLLKGISLIFPSIVKNKAFIQMLATTIFFSIPLIIYIILKKKPLKEIFLLKPLSFKNIIVIILLAFFIQPSLMLINLITNLLTSPILPEESVNNVSNAILELSKAPFWQTFLAVAIFPAIFEEVIFRGVFLKEYEDYPAKVGIIFSGIFFGIMHCTVIQLIYATVAGIIIAIIVKITKSIWAGILFHFILNGSQITLSNFLLNYLNEYLELANSNASPKLIYMSFQIIIFFFGFLLYFLVSFVLLYWTYRAFKKVNKENIEILKKEELEKTLEFPKPFNIYFVLSIILFILFIIWDTYIA